MIFLGSSELFGSGCLPLLFCCLLLLLLLSPALLLLLLLLLFGGAGRFARSEGAAVLSVKRGAGKLGFLSMASIRRLNLRKSASARMRVDSRSIVPESSLTAKQLVCAAPKKRRNLEPEEATYRISTPRQSVASVS